MIRNIRSRMSLHRHVRPFLMPPARRRHLAISHTFDQNRHGKTMGNRTVTFSKCTRVTFGQAGSEESPHLRHMRCTDSAGIHRLVRRRKTEEAIFLHCCIGDYRRAVVNGCYRSVPMFIQLSGRPLLGKWQMARNPQACHAHD